MNRFRSLPTFEKLDNLQLSNTQGGIFAVNAVMFRFHTKRIYPTFPLRRRAGRILVSVTKVGFFHVKTQGGLL